MIASLLPDLQRFTLDPSIISRRLRARLSLAEFLGVLFPTGLAIILAFQYQALSVYPADFKHYLDGPSPIFFYGYWLLPFFDLLKLIPFNAAYILWCVLNILGCLFAVRVFGGRPLLILLSYQLLASLNYGQISGLLAGGLALCWWGMANKKWTLAGLGLLLALTKYQVGLPFGLCLIWFAGIPLRSFFRMLVAPGLIFVLTLFLYPLWPLDILQKLSGFPYIHLGITLWYFIGAWSLLFWIPALLLPLSKSQRFFSLMCLCTFAVPYFLQFDLLTLFALPVGWLPLGGLVGFLFPLLGQDIIRAIVIIPFTWYLWIILPSAWTLIKRHWLRQPQIFKIER